MYKRKITWKIVLSTILCAACFIIYWRFTVPLSIILCAVCSIILKVYSTVPLSTVLCAVCSIILKVYSSFKYNIVCSMLYYILKVYSSFKFNIVCSMLYYILKDWKIMGHCGILINLRHASQVIWRNFMFSSRGIKLCRGIKLTKDYQN